MILSPRTLTTGAPAPDHPFPHGAGKRSVLTSNLFLPPLTTVTVPCFPPVGHGFEPKRAPRSAITLSGMRFVVTYRPRCRSSPRPASACLRTNSPNPRQAKVDHMPRPHPSFTRIFRSHSLGRQAGTVNKPVGGYSQGSTSIRSVHCPYIRVLPPKCNRGP